MPCGSIIESTWTLLLPFYAGLHPSAVHTWSWRCWNTAGPTTGGISRHMRPFTRGHETPLRPYGFYTLFPSFLGELHSPLHETIKPQQNVEQRPTVSRRCGRAKPPRRPSRITATCNKAARRDEVRRGATAGVAQECDARPNSSHRTSTHQRPCVTGQDQSLRLTN